MPSSSAETTKAKVNRPMLLIVDYLWHFFVHRPACWLTGEKPRSLQWPAVRRKWLASHPFCAVCGEKGPDVHHLLPFHLHPEFELDPGNLISLGRSCGHHLTFGHLGNSRSTNSNCRLDVTYMRRRYENRP